MAGARSKPSRPGKASARPAPPAVKVKPHSRKPPQKPQPAKPLGPGHAVESLMQAFPELKR